jgi:hypothetical protein
LGPSCAIFEDPKEQLEASRTPTIAKNVDSSSGSLIFHRFVYNKNLSAIFYNFMSNVNENKARAHRELFYELSIPDSLANSLRFLIKHKHALHRTASGRGN